MDGFDDFIEVDDNDLMLGDQHLKIDTVPSDDKKKETKKEEDKKDDKAVITNTDDDLLEVDDAILNPQKDSDVTVDTKTDKDDADEDDESSEEGDEGDGEETELTAIGVFGNSLAEQGFFPDIEEEELTKIESEDDLSDLLIKQLNVTFGQWQDGYKQNLANNLVNDGYFTKEQIEDKLPQVYTDEQIKESIDVAKNVIRKYYKRTNVPDREIDRIIESRDDLEESAIELNKLNEELDKTEKESLAARLKQQEEQAVVQRQKFNEELKKNTFEYSEFIPGRKLRKQDKETVFMNIEPTLKKVNSNLPKYAPILAYLDKYGLLDANFNKVINEGKSKSVSELEKILTTKKRSTSKGGTPSKRTGGVINIDDGDVPNLYR